MSARFVSTGAIDTQTGDAVALPTPATAATTTTKKKDEWTAVQAQVEAERQAREAKRKAAISGEAAGGGRSLFEVLEANKAAKQAAFEEANKIRNQFRALDEDEIGFLEEVEARKREEAERGRREMEEGLRVFREARRGERKREEDGDGYGYGDDDDGDERGRQVGVGEGEWRVGSKRKRGRRRGEGEGAGGSSSLLLKGVKRTVGGSGGGASGVKTGEDEATGAREKEVVQRNTAETQAEAEATKTVETAPEIAQKPSVAAAAAPKPKLGLVDYGSDDDSE